MMNMTMILTIEITFTMIEGGRLWHLKDDGQFDNLMTMTEGDYSVDN